MNQVCCAVLRTEPPEDVCGRSNGHHPHGGNICVARCKALSEQQYPMAPYRHILAGDVHDVLGFLFRATSELQRVWANFLARQALHSPIQHNREA